MKRAILVSSGTLAGLVAVLTYSGGDTNPAVAAAAGAGAGLGGPPPAESTDPGTAAPAGSGAADPGGPGSASPQPGSAAPAATPAATAATPVAAAATPAAARPAPAATKAVAAKPTTAATKAAAVPAPVPAPTKATPKPTPTPVAAAVAKDFVGSLQTHKYGKVQIGIRVKAGKIIAVWPVVYPDGDSQPYSDFSIPVFKSETMKAQSADIANVSGATLTWQSWKASLQSAMHKAGL